MPDLYRKSRKEDCFIGSVEKTHKNPCNQNRNKPFCKINKKNRQPRFFSENSEKVTNPGNKTIYRVYDKETGKIKADLICLVGESFDESEPLLLFDPIEPWKKTKLPAGSYALRELLVPIFQKGKCVYESPKVMDIREYCTKEKDTLWDETRRLVNPHNVYVDLSKKLYDMKIGLLDKMSQ